MEHTIWEILSKVYESTWTNKNNLRWNLSLAWKWWFFTIQKNYLVCREWQPTSEGEIPLAQYCAETAFRANLLEQTQKVRLYTSLSTLVKTGIYQQHKRMVVGIKWGNSHKVLTSPYITNKNSNSIIITLQCVLDASSQGRRDEVFKDLWAQRILRISWSLDPKRPLILATRTA